MEELLKLDISGAHSALVSLSITAGILTILPLLCAFGWKKRCGKAVSFKPLLIGAAGFLVSARVLELGVHMVCIVMDNPVSRFINGNTLAYMLYGALMAGIFEECGRYVVIKFLMKKNKTRENMVMYGIGHGGIEVWAITLMGMMSLLAVASALVNGGIAAALPVLGLTGEVPEELAGSAAAVILSAANFSAVGGVLSVLERVGAMAVHIAFTVIVAYGVMKGEKRYLPLAVLGHAAVDALPALYQRGAASMIVSELWLFAWVAGLAVWAVKLYKKMPSGTPADAASPATPYPS